MAGLMNSDAGNIDRITIEVEVPPHGDAGAAAGRERILRELFRGQGAESRTIRFGLQAVKAWAKTWSR